MSNMRVYEAARKMNMQAGELVKILEGKGIHASPISTITEETFNELLEELVGSAGASEAESIFPLKLISFKDKSAANQESSPSEEEPEPEEEPIKPMLSLAPELTEEETDLAETMPSLDSTQAIKTQIEPLDEESEADTEDDVASVDDSKEELAASETEKENEGKATVFAPLAAEPFAAESPAAAPLAASGIQSRNRPSIVAYSAFILAALALGGLIWVNNNVTLQASQVKDVAASIQATNDRVDGVDLANELQGQLIAANRADTANLSDRVSAQARLDTKIELSANASALEEMASALPPAQAQRVMELSRRMAELGSAL
ncbi:MAG: translation initiation factor IF-2 N-terminal domain-containing protein [Nitrospinota bacterium]|nr:translation initiation factor IF-2 N-terminal domain-containing protein [Nitrospinota bacterium]